MFKHAIAPVIALAATVGLFAIPDAASAETVGQSVAVKYADLDLTTPAGRQKLERRIDRAARQVCALDDTITGTRIHSLEAIACYEQALRDVREHVAAATTGNRPGA